MVDPKINNIFDIYYTYRKNFKINFITHHVLKYDVKQNYMD